MAKSPEHKTHRLIALFGADAIAAACEVSKPTVYRWCDDVSYSTMLRLVSAAPDYGLCPGKVFDICVEDLRLARDRALQLRDAA